MSAIDTDYRIVAFAPNGDRIVLDEAVTSLTWGESKDELAARASVTVINERIGKKRIAQFLNNGAHVRIYAGKGDKLKERFRGSIFRNRTSHSAVGERMHEFVAYDRLRYLLMSEDDRYYPAGKTGEQIIRDICRAWNVPVGDLKGPTEKLSKKMWRSMSPAEMCVRTLRSTRKEGGGRWLLRIEDGKVVTLKRGSNRRVIQFEAEDLHGLDVDRSIESLVTRTRIVGREKNGSKVLATADSDLRDDFGTFQRLINRADYDNPAKAKRAALQELRQNGREQKMRTLIAPDVSGLRVGDRLAIKARTASGIYIVQSVEHDALGKMMMMDVDSPTQDDLDIDFEVTGLYDWIPPDDRNRGGGGGGAEFSGSDSAALAIGGGVLPGPQWVYDKALPAARRAGGGFTITSWKRTYDTIAGPSMSYHYNGGRALDIVASPLSRLNALYAELRKEGPVELLWQVEDHFDHLHSAWETP